MRMNTAYKKRSHKKLRTIEKLQLGEQEKLALYLFSQRSNKTKQPLRMRDLYFMDQSPLQIRAIETLGAQL
jgi:hypothetical protein